MRAFLQGRVVVALLSASIAWFSASASTSHTERARASQALIVSEQRWEAMSDANLALVRRERDEAGTRADGLQRKLDALAAAKPQPVHRRPGSPTHATTKRACRR